MNKKTMQMSVLVFLLFILVGCGKSDVKEIKTVLDSQLEFGYNAVQTIEYDDVIDCTYNNGFNILTDRQLIYTTEGDWDPLEVSLIDGKDIPTFICQQEDSICIGKQIDGGFSIINQQTSTEYHGISNVTKVLLDDEFTLACSISGGISCFTKEGSHLYSINDVFVYDIVKTEDEIICLGKDEDQMSFSFFSLDIASGKIYRTIQTDIVLPRELEFVKLVWKTYNEVYLCVGNELFYCDFKKAMAWPILNFQKQGIYNPKGIAVGDNGTMIIIYDSNKIKLLERCPIEEIENSEVIRLAMVSNDASPVLSQEIIEYNKLHPHLQIEVINYRERAHDLETALQILNTEILAGNGPDLLDCSFMSKTQYRSYIEKNIFCPLDDLINSKVFHEGILTSYTIGDHLYSVCGAFTIIAYVGPRSIVGRTLETSMETILDDLHISDLSVVLGYGGFDLLKTICETSIEKYIEDNKFNTEAFSKLLETCSPVNELQNVGRIAYDTINGLYGYYVFQEINLHWDQELFSVIGLTEERDVTFLPCYQLAVCSNSNKLNEAKDFIRFCLSDSRQKAIIDAFPVNSDAFDFQIASMCEDSSMPLIDEIESDELRLLYDHVSTLYSGDPEIVDIILQEVGAYYAGQKTKEATVALIEDRVNLFLEEGK